MEVSGLFQAFIPSMAGMRAERTRLNVIAMNIANANTFNKDGAYTRRSVVFQEVLGSVVNGGGASPGSRSGVSAIKVYEDTKSEYPTVFDPGHAAADENGFYKRPNVNLMFEMVDLAAARRAYGANLATLRATRTMIRSVLNFIGAR
ncbi:MAG: flagellar basal body rod protein FlgC [Planctomycetota bacterium]